jgi:N-acetylglucosamine-6-phosphate deacetylase
MINHPVNKARFFDLQVNGYAGVDFNDSGLSVEQIRTACEQLRSDGVDQILATVITDDPVQMAIRLTNIARACESDELVRAVVHGIHIEGPFLNPADGTVGAHPRQFVQPPNLDVMKSLLDAGQGLTRLVTLAPEIDGGLALIRFLADRGVVVSAGHCDPSRDELSAAIDVGLSMFTHLGNGCSLKLDRHDNIIQRVLSLSDQIWCCFIADGVHVPPFALANYLKLAGIDRSIVVSDAMSAAGLGPGKYSIGSVDVEVDDQNRALLPNSDGRLAGSVATMPWLQEVLTDRVGLSLGEVERVLIRNPRTALGIET